MLGIVEVDVGVVWIGVEDVWILYLGEKVLGFFEPFEFFRFFIYGWQLEKHA